MWVLTRPAQQKFAGRAFPSRSQKAANPPAKHLFAATTSFIYRDPRRESYEDSILHHGQMAAINRALGERVCVAIPRSLVDQDDGEDDC